MGSDTEARTDAYLRTLLLLLIAATFFEGYDGAILSLVLLGIRDTFNVPESALGISRASIELGLGAAFFLARAGDRWGRRTLLLWSVMGYTVTTTLTAFSTNLAMFTALQSFSRVCLGAEYVVALTMIVVGIQRLVGSTWMKPHCRPFCLVRRTVASEIASR